MTYRVNSSVGGIPTRELADLLAIAIEIQLRRELPPDGVVTVSVEEETEDAPQHEHLKGEQE